LRVVESPNSRGVVRERARAASHHRPRTLTDRHISDDLKKIDECWIFTPPRRGRVDMSCLEHAHAHAHAHAMFRRRPTMCIVVMPTTPRPTNERILAQAYRFASTCLSPSFSGSLNSPCSPAALACFLSQSSRRILRNAESGDCYPSSFKSRSRLIGSFVRMFFRFSIRAETKEQLVSTDVTMGMDDAFASNQKRGNVKMWCQIDVTPTSSATTAMQTSTLVPLIQAGNSLRLVCTSSQGCSIGIQHAVTSVSQRCYYACYTGSGSSLSLRRRYVSLSPTL
jgi:hypothetical protein